MKAIKPAISPAAIFRIPRFALDATLTESWPDLKTAIKTSSPAFYDQIRELTADGLESCDAKVLHTIRKYFNRAKYRPVPYGSFASIGIIDLEKIGPRAGQVKVSDHPIAHDYPDWPYSADLPYTFEEVIKNNAYLFTNSSYYTIREEIRFVSLSAEDKYEIAEISSDPLVMQVLDECRTPITINSLTKKLGTALADNDTLFSLIEEMIGVKLLLTSFDINIIGEDYFRRRGVAAHFGPATYTILERPHLSGCPDPKLLQALPRLIPVLQQLSPPAKQRHMEEFIRKFQQKFDQQQILLMVALDPEIGVGYGDLEQGGSNDDLVLQLAAGRNAEKPDNTKLQSWFSQQLQTPVPTEANILRLETFKADSTFKPLPVANSISAMVTFCDGMVNLEHLGGATANALAGRFTLMGGNILKACKQIADTEQAANPDVIFFDISYAAEKKVDNVNRRKHIYTHLLSLLTYDTSKHPLSLDEITVRVSQGRVILWSQKLGKRLVPRYASAYNYSRSDLPLFRFLCDLQHQGIQTSLLFDIKQAIPGLSAYPRIQYENIILSPAQWQINFSEFKSEADLVRKLSLVKSSRFLKFGNGDQKLVIDTDILSDVQMLYVEGKKVNTAFLEEAFIPAHGTVHDESGNSYYSQFVFPLQHNNKIYDSLASFKTSHQDTRHFMPGSEWLYFELYCHPSRMDELLTGRLPELLESCRLKKWFFIRYSENGHHIRLRLNVRDRNDIGQIVLLVNRLFEDALSAGVISDVQIKTYSREIERYGTLPYTSIETHFFKDSQYVFNLLCHALSDSQKYRICLDLLIILQSTGLFPDEAFLTMASGVFESLRAEHHVNADMTKAMNEQYKRFRQQEAVPLSQQTLDKLNSFRKSFIAMLDDCPTNRRQQLLIDCFHMHVNRLFTEHQRTHEMLLYFFLTKEWLTQKMMRKSREVSA